MIYFYVFMIIRKIFLKIVSQLFFDFSILQVTSMWNYKIYLDIKLGATTPNIDLRLFYSSLKHWTVQKTLLNEYIEKLLLLLTS